jgi:hypothetical protein
VRRRIPLATTEASYPRCCQTTSRLQLLRKSALGGLLVRVVAECASGKLLDDRIKLYAELVGTLRAGPDGKLLLADAGEQVGDSIVRWLLKPLTAPLDALRAKLALLALIPLALTIVTAQLVGRSRARRSAPSAA